jgi:hypothetical protein
MSQALSSPHQEAAAAIVALINSSPRSPRQDEIEAILGRIGAAPAHEASISDLRIRLRKAMEKADAALQVACHLLPGTECDLADAERARWLEEIAAMEKEIPNPPRCYEDLAVRAEVARYGGDVVDGKLMEAEDEEDVFLGPAGRLIEAVLQFAKGAKP